MIAGISIFIVAVRCLQQGSLLYHELAMNSRGAASVREARTLQVFAPSSTYLSMYRRDCSRFISSSFTQIPVLPLALGREM